MERKPSYSQRQKLFTRVIKNSGILSGDSVMVSAETMLNKRALPHLGPIDNQIIGEMKCARHEVRPSSDYVN